MFDTDPAEWAYATWVLYVLAAFYLAGFLVFWFRFHALERAAKRQGGEAVVRYNDALRGFPNAIYAKMFGKRAFEVKGEDAERAEAAKAEPRPASR